jgi:5-methylcytosine-specific restriction enzyme A
VRAIIKEWIGKNDDEAVPPRVKVRVFTRDGGKCINCGLLVAGSLLPAYDHRVALINGGENRESNIQLMCNKCHAVKTGVDVAEKSRMYYKRVKALGIKRKRRTIGGRKFDGTPVPPKWR